MVDDIQESNIGIYMHHSNSKVSILPNDTSSQDLLLETIFKKCITKITAVIYDPDMSDGQIMIKV